MRRTWLFLSRMTILATALGAAAALATIARRSGF